MVGSENERVRGARIVLTTDSSAGQKIEYGYRTFSSLVTTVKYAF